MIRPFPPTRALIALLAGLTLVQVEDARSDVINFAGLAYPASLPDPLPTGSTGQYDNGVDLNGGFTAQGASFKNSYGSFVDSTGKTVDYFSGWAYSNVKDTVRSTFANDPNDYTHEFAAITQTAPAGSGNYGVAFADAPRSDYINLPTGMAPVSFQITNTVYAYLSMTQGDGFVRTPFVAGDFLRLTVLGYSGLGATGTLVGSFTVDLANYATNSDLPLTSWLLVDLTRLNAGGTVASLGFTMDSSRHNQFGSVLPSTFAMDNLVVSAVPEPTALVSLGIGLVSVGIGIRRRDRA